MTDAGQERVARLKDASLLEGSEEAFFFALGGENLLGTTAE